MDLKSVSEKTSGCRDLKNFKLYGTNNLPAHLIKAEDIINKHTLSWDKQLLEEFCLPIDKGRIIPLPLISKMEKQVWLP